MKVFCKIQNYMNIFQNLLNIPVKENSWNRTAYKKIKITIQTQGNNKTNLQPPTYQLITYFHVRLVYSITLYYCFRNSCNYRTLFEKTVTCYDSDSSVHERALPSFEYSLRSKLSCWVTFITKLSISFLAFFLNMHATFHYSFNEIIVPLQ